MVHLGQFPAASAKSGRCRPQFGRIAPIQLRVWPRWVSFCQFGARDVGIPVIICVAVFRLNSWPPANFRHEIRAAYRAANHPDRHSPGWAQIGRRSASDTSRGFGRFSMETHLVWNPTRLSAVYIARRVGGDSGVPLRPLALSTSPPQSQLGPLAFLQPHSPPYRPPHSRSAHLVVNAIGTADTRLRRAHLSRSP